MAPAPGTAPLFGDVAPSTMQMAGAGMGPTPAALDAQQAQTAELMQRIRDIDTSIRQLAADVPDLAQEAQTAGQALKQMVVKAAALAQTQTASAAMLPGGGM